MSTQPEALRLAELLEQGPCRSGDTAIASELRRLHRTLELIVSDMELVSKSSRAHPHLQRFAAGSVSRATSGEEL